MKKNIMNNKDSIYTEILNKIQYCEWEPGMLISETRLAEMFGVSRTPIREALSVLSQDGFVDIVPQKGSYVSHIDLNRIRDILFMRYHLELPILLDLARKKTDIPTSIKKVILLMNFEVSNENWKETVQLDYSIHSELLQMSGHEHIWNMIRSELPHYTRFRFFDPEHREFKGDNPRSLREHEAILECISTGNTDGLEDVMRSHYDYTFELRKQYNIDRMNIHPDYFIKSQLDVFLN